MIGATTRPGHDEYVARTQEYRYRFRVARRASNKEHRSATKSRIILIFSGSLRCICRMDARNGDQWGSCAELGAVDVCHECILGRWVSNPMDVFHDTRTFV